jgi:sulfite reductase (NADPH) flavoprotein alpha-component
MREEEDGGKSGHFYVCGQAGFAHSVMTALRAVCARCAHGSQHEREQTARMAMRRMVATGRYCQDTFTTFASSAAGGERYDASEIVLRNDDVHGYWMVVRGHVYDMTEFRHLHPGGARIIDDNAGLDATAEYEAVLHHEDSEVDAMLAMYKIGHVRRLDFGLEWGIAFAGGKLRYLPLHEAFRAWVRHLFLVVEHENALRNDFTFLESALTSADGARALTALKLQLVGDTQTRFLAGYLPALVGESLSELWSLTAGLCHPDLDAGRMRRQLAAVAASSEASEARAGAQHLRVLHHELGSSEERWRAAATLVAELRQEDARLLAQVKGALREGVRAFEQLERDAIRDGGERLVTALSSVPTLLAEGHRRLAALGRRFRELGQRLEA